VLTFTSNAINTPQGQPVTIPRHQNEHQLQISVQDLGRGMIRDQKPFSKNSANTSPNHWLRELVSAAIAKALVEEHGGSIGVRSIPGRAACFLYSPNGAIASHHTRSRRALTTFMRVKLITGGPGRKVGIYRMAQTSDVALIT